MAELAYIGIPPDLEERLDNLRFERCSVWEQLLRWKERITLNEYCQRNRMQYRILRRKIRAAQNIDWTEEERQRVEAFRKECLDELFELLFQYWYMIEH